MKKFTGDLAFLSNFEPAPVTGRDGLHYPSVENAYQALKWPIDQRGQFQGISAAESKRLGRKGPNHLTETDRLYHMEYLLRQKFQLGNELADRLEKVSVDDLVELNSWHDIFWGKCTCENHQGTGLNHLGRILEKIQRENKDERWNIQKGWVKQIFGRT